MKKNAKPASKAARKSAAPQRTATKSAKATPATKAGSTLIPEKFPFNRTLGKKAASELILNSKGVISCYIKKDDGTYRWMAGRVQSKTPNNLGQVGFTDMVVSKTSKKDTRTLTLPNVLYIRTKGECIKVGR